MASQIGEEVTPPVLHGPTSKERKYDRQLRLWAANGQAALEDAHLLLINSGPGVVGVEAIKNLVLPGVGQFTIVDPAIVKEEDLGVNFFLTEEDLGHSRAEACTKWLQELNPDVQGHADASPIEYFLTQDGQLSKFTHILVALPLPSELLVILSKHSQSTGVPVFYFHSVGFYAHVTIQLPHAFPIVDTHPDPATIADLRLLNPWPELLAITKEKTAGLEQMDDEQHGHVPYALLLLHYVELWKEAHNGQPPQNYKEKTEFRELVRKGERTSNAEGGEENFGEAASAVLKNLNPAVPSSAAKEVFASPECQQLTPESPEFWVIAHAISDFYDEHGVLPVSGTLPDMKAKSSDYIQVQNVYKSKARKDAAEIMERVMLLEDKLGRKHVVAQKEIEAFCKSANHIKLIRGGPPQIVEPGEIPKWNDRASYAVSSLSNPDALMPLYIGFLAYDSYANSHPIGEQIGTGHAESDEDYAIEVAKLTGIAHKFLDSLISEAGTFIEDPEYSQIKVTLGNVMAELARAGGGELHNISAVMGGIVAQEVIKIITKQYVPVDNICLFDGVFSKTSVLKL